MDRIERSYDLASWESLIRQMRAEAARCRARYAMERGARLSEAMAAELEQIAVRGMGRLVTIDEAVWFGVPRPALERAVRQGTIRVHGRSADRRVRWRDAEALLPHEFWETAAAQDTPAAQYIKHVDHPVDVDEAGNCHPSCLDIATEVIEPLRELMESWRDEAELLRTLREDALAARCDRHRRELELQLMFLEGEDAEP